MVRLGSFRCFLAFQFLTAALISEASAHPGYQARIQEISQRLDENPDNPALYLLRATEYSQHGDWGPAEADFAKAEALAGRQFILVKLGRHYIRRTRLADAEQAFSERLDANRQDLAALIERARARDAMGKKNAALSDYERFFELAGERLTPRDILDHVDLLQLLKPNEPQLALNVLDEGRSKIGLNVRLQRRAVSIEQEAGMIPAAVRRWSETKDIAKSSPSWKLLMANLHADNRDFAAAHDTLISLREELAQLKQTPARQKILAQSETLLMQIEQQRTQIPGSN